ncbi:hypothetical protein FHW36_10274 [Chitinophaga polysaccharea]|uniref:Uncharacterized protein n=1 Tax=Chitinophaga polysaccharea TaxID=1293035 RepID=A0A561PW12_9BACT|nr:hypothetical protein [Chitinophaga polysaccharea]TWF42319.1 hypothetical protein FHW36_10274 [Chitinophaga polysaccharea]
MKRIIPGVPTSGMPTSNLLDGLYLDARRRQVIQFAEKYDRSLDR